MTAPVVGHRVSRFAVREAFGADWNGVVVEETPTFALVEVTRPRKARFHLSRRLYDTRPGCIGSNLVRRRVLVCYFAYLSLC